MDKFVAANNICSCKIKSVEQPTLLTEVGGSHVWDYSLALCKTPAVPGQSSVSSGHKHEMAQHAGSLQEFKAPLPLESLEEHGDKEGKAREKEQCGRNKSQFPGCHEQLLREGSGVWLGPSKRTTSCVGLGRKLTAETISRVTQGCGVTACHCPVLFIMALFASPTASSTGSC